MHTPAAYFDDADALLDVAAAGKPFILVGGEGRQRIGEIVVAADAITPEVVNFMCHHARGLVCLAMSAGSARRLRIPLQPQIGETQRKRRAFGVAIEAREGVTTGISAFDRAHTIAVACDPERGAIDLVSPGHVFPVIADDDGQGPAEVALAMLALAGRQPMAALCEMLSEDGSVSDVTALFDFAHAHDLPIGSASDLARHFRLQERRAGVA